MPISARAPTVGDHLQFGLLGSVVAHRDGRPLPLGRRQERLLLAILLLNVGQPVDADRLIDLLWDDRMPSDPRSTLHVYVSRLRRGLAATGSDPDTCRLETGANGYTLHADPQTVDAHRFVTDVTLARRQARPEERAAVLRRALALWRGTPLGDVAGPALRHRLCGDLSELRLSALELRIEADLELGHHHRLTSELVGLVAEHPTRERLVAALMTALFRCGRRSEALAVYERTVAELAERLGIDPGTELRDLRLAILRDDPTLTTPPAEPDERVPRQLPRAPVPFVGRDGLRDQIVASLASGTQHGVVVVLHGPAGVGKTSVAVSAAHSAATTFPDGLLYANLRGSGTGLTPVTPDQIIRRFLRALRTPPEAIPPDFDEVAALWRSTIADRRLLVLLDDAGSAAQIKPLLPGVGPTSVVVTARARLGSIDGALHLNVPLLDSAAAADLIERIVGAQSDPATIAEVAAWCGRLPLALRIAAIRLADIAPHNAGGLLDELRDTSRRLGALETDDLAVRVALASSYQRMQRDESRSASALRRFASVPLADIGLDAMIAMIDTDPLEGAVAMRRLVDIGLVDVVDGDRFQIHDLVRLFGADRARLDDTPTDLAAAHHRLGRHYRITMREAGRLIRPSAFGAGAAAHGAGDMSMFHDSAGAVAWLDHERANIVALARWAADRTDELSDLAEDARMYTSDYLNKGAHLDEMLALAEIATTAAELAGRTASAADNAGALALAQWRARRLPDAIATAERGLALAVRCGAIRSEANCLNKLGVVLGAAGRIDESQNAFDRSAALRRADGDPYGEAISLHNLADMLLNNARPAPAAAALRAALPLRTAVGDDVGTLLTRFTLAKAQYLLGEVAAAEAMLHESLRLSIDLDERAQRWQILIVLAQTALRGGDPAVALDHAVEAEEISRRLGHRYGLLLCARISARAQAAAGRHEDAKRYARTAAAIEAEGDFRANRSLELIVPNDGGTDREASSLCRADDLSLL